MIINTETFKEGFNSIIEMNGNGAEMQMDVGILELTKGNAYDLFDSRKEMAILLLTGEVEFNWDGRAAFGSRQSLQDEMPYCLHVAKGTEVSVKAIANSEVYVQKTLNDHAFESKFYEPKDIQCTRAGTGEVLKGCTRRNIRTVFDFDNAPYSNMVLGEVVNFPGKWSSYPPHFHPQPEVYFYKFDKKQGFGACFIGDEVYQSRNNSLALIRSNVIHPQVAAPGYTMFYVWGIRHLDGDPWKKTRIDMPEHVWTLTSDAKIWDEKE
ncbi:MAG TPA: hypothetical protein DD738_01840 [Ruminiclostridium sp.]|nr:hypothetical protein [Ruminiclostridium sp.]